ncbi:MAG TPA: fused MFS/spermidine synthase [Candidatus Eisenbacteria bacterium]|nr:fused MFS/spermidine synthase [Candidatus Eisenbacteria bacterium]
MLFLFSVTMFLSAALLFVVQPMFARLVLPLLGGSPAVWNTVMVCYQVALLGGYAYAHALGRRGPSWWLAHVGLLGAALYLLPLRLGREHVPPAGGDPVPWLLWTMATTVGPPFLLLSATGPLVQRWFALTRHAHARDPYFLYAASNVGSILGLLCYPFVLEPRWTLAEQSRAWAIGYGVTAALIGVCALAASRAQGAWGEAQEGSDTPATAAAESVTWRRRLKWVALAFVPSSLMLGVTTHLSMDLVAMPLLWIVPLTIYLVTFILAFAKRAVIKEGALARIRVYALLGVLIVLVSGASEPIPVVAGLHLAALFAVGLTCHAALAGDRPGVSRLTEFYVWVAAGGALGGAFNALLAPVLFHAVVEYPLVLVAACLLAPSIPPRATPSAAEPRGRDIRGDSFPPARAPWTSLVARDVMIAALFAVLAAGTVLWVRFAGHAWRRSELILLVAVLTLPLFAFRRRAPRFGLAFAGVLLLPVLAGGSDQPVLHAERSFFGIHRIQETRHDEGTMHRLVHGTTVHGMQWFEPRRCGEPLSYYHRLGPVGQVFAALGGADRTQRVGVVGLGSGALSAYATAGQSWTYFEIDPAVVRIASDPEWFCYLEGSAAPYRVLLGDARLSLAADTTRYDLLVLDAYSSDAIPVHLLTREAFAQYLEHLRPRGVLVLHLSNIHFDLGPVAARIARDAGLAFRMRGETLAAGHAPTGFLPSQWAVVARNEQDLAALDGDSRWQPLPQAAGSPLWTDDYSSLVSVLK